MFCTQCHQELPKEANFCMVCGSKIKNPDPPRPQDTPTEIFQTKTLKKEFNDLKTSSNTEKIDIEGLKTETSRLLDKYK